MLSEKNVSKYCLDVRLMGQTSKLDKSLFRRFSIRPNWVRPRKISVLYSLCFSVRAQSRAKSWIFNSIWVLLDVSCGSLLILVGWVLSKTSSWSSSSISSSFSSLYFSRFLITVIYSASSDDFVRSFQLNEAIIWKNSLNERKFFVFYKMFGQLVMKRIHFFNQRIIWKCSTY